MAAPDDVLRDRLEAAGRERAVTVVGRADGPPGRPLVLVLHGSGQTAERHRRASGRGLDALAADGRAVVAYLDGYRGHWNDARRESGFAARREGVDDVAFARAVVERLARTHGIDRDRVVASGFSNGGQMVLRLLHEAPELLAGAVVTGANLPEPASFLAHDPAPRPVPTVLVHGTRDRIAPYGGGAFPWLSRVLFRVGGRMRSAPGTAAYFAARNGITGPPSVEVLPHRAGSRGATTVEATRWQQEGRPPVDLLTVRDGGHTVPGSARGGGVGRIAEDVTLAELVSALIEGASASPS